MNTPTGMRTTPQQALPPKPEVISARTLKADERAKTLLETYKEEAIRSLRDLENPNLKGLLRCVLGKIFNDTEIKGWSKEFEQKNGLPIPAANSAGTTASVTGRFCH